MFYIVYIHFKQHQRQKEASTGRYRVGNWKAVSGSSDFFSFRKPELFCLHQRQQLTGAAFTYWRTSRLEKGKDPSTSVLYQMLSLSWFFGFLLLLLLVSIYTSDAANDGLKSFPCKSQDDCSVLGPSYECFNGEYCIKWSIAGCLRDKHGAPSRVCNSNDSEEVIQMGLRHQVVNCWMSKR